MRRIFSSFAFLALAVAPLIAVGDSRNTLTWDALNDSGSVRLDSRYKERVGRETTQQELEVKLSGVAPGTPVQVQINGQNVFPMVADSGGQCGALYQQTSPSTDGWRPAENQRIDDGDVVRVFNSSRGIDISAVYRLNREL